MPAHTWVSEGAVGILKNHFLSKKLLEVAMAECKVLQFVSDHGIQFGRGQGETINVMHIEPFPEPASAELEEDTRIPIDKTKFGNRVLIVKEFGRGVEYSRLMKELMAFNVENQFQKKLKDQMKRVLDTRAAQAFQHTDVKVIFSPTTLTGGTWSTNGTPGALAIAPFTFDHCTAIVDYMRDTIHVPPYAGDHYIGLSCNRNMRSLKQDRNFTQWAMYAGKVDFIYVGEQLKTEGIRWVEVNRSEAFANLAGNSTVLGEAVVFGDEAVAMIEVVTPHLLLDSNFQNDFNRKQAAAWYGLLAMGAVWDSADDGKAKIVRIDST